jgi:serine/threonine protein kinase
MEVNIKRYVISYDNFMKKYHGEDEIKKIGAGGAGIVYKVTPTYRFFKYPSIKHIEVPIVIKVLSIPNELYSDAELPKILRREYYINKLLEIHEQRYTSKHGSVNGTSYFGKIYDVIKLHDAYIVYMEFIEGYTLMKLTQNIKKIRKDNTDVFKTMDYSFYIPLFIRMIEGISIIHDAGIVHLDIAHRNIMFYKGDIKYIDFGESCFVDSDKDNFLNVESFKKFECHNIKKPTPYSDVYNTHDSQSLKDEDLNSIGMIMFNFLFYAREYHSDEIPIEKLDNNMGKWYMQFKYTDKFKPLSPKSYDIIVNAQKTHYNELEDKDKVDVMYEEFSYRNKGLFDLIKDEELRSIVREVSTGRDLKPSIIVKRLRDVYDKLVDK